MIPSPIGLFDSGIGGLSILGQLFRFLPGREFFYLADHAFSPYGNKTEREILPRCTLMVEELLKKDVRMVVVACNTATAAALGPLRDRFSFLPFVGVEPYLNYLNNQGPSQVSKKRLVVLTTPSMEKMERFLALKRRLDPEQKIKCFPCPHLADIVERFFYRDNHQQNSSGLRRDLERQVALELAPLLHGRQTFTHAILGCTHYELIASVIAKVLQVECIGPSVAVAKRVAKRVAADAFDDDNTKSKSKSPCTFYKSTADGGGWRKLPFNFLNAPLLLGNA